MRNLVNIYVLFLRSRGLAAPPTLLSIERLDAARHGQGTRVRGRDPDGLLDEGWHRRLGDQATSLASGRPLARQPKLKHIKHVVLSDWAQFEDRLRSELIALGHHTQVTTRNFTRFSSDSGRPVDRLQIALATGTDRDASSEFWNWGDGGHDHDHDRYPRGKRPEGIIYANTLDPHCRPYKVLFVEGVDDVTESLDEHHVILIYKTSELDRVSLNEYWFKSTPMDAALLAFTVQDPDLIDDADDEAGSP